MAQDREFGTGGLARPLSGPDRVQPETSAIYPTAEEVAREIAPPALDDLQPGTKDVWIEAVAAHIQRAIDAAVAPVKVERDDARAACMNADEKLAAARTAAGELIHALDVLAKVADHIFCGEYNVEDLREALELVRIVSREQHEYRAYAPKGERS